VAIAIGVAVCVVLAVWFIGTGSLVVDDMGGPGRPRSALAIPTRADLAAYPRAARALLGRGRAAGGKLTEGERLDVVVAVEPVVVGD
jgi:hypothetical protein